MFSKPHGKEMWVLLLEKAFAKMVGNYGALKGGLGRLPFKAFTGNMPIEYWISASGDKISPAYNEGVKAPHLDKEMLFNVLHGAISDRLIVCAGTQGKGEVTDKQGLVSGHMYSVLDVCTVNNGQEKLIRLRNPWGKSEWTGAYSENDTATKGWKADDNGYFLGLFSNENRKSNNGKDDGIFWMPFDEFLKGYDYICLCTIAHDINNLPLDLREDKQELGILAGFFHGTYEFCCKCKGFLGLWCPNDLSTIEKINKYKNKDALHTGDSIAGTLYKPFKSKVSTTDEDLDDV